MCTYEFIPKIVGTVHHATNGSHDPCPPPSKLADEADIDDAFTKYGKNHPHSEHEDNLSSPESPTNGRILDDLYNVLWERWTIFEQVLVCRPYYGMVHMYCIDLNGVGFFFICPLAYYSHIYVISQALWALRSSNADASWEKKTLT